METTILSLGAGVQSTALLLLAIDGVIEKPSHAVFADTGWESLAVYEHLGRLETVGRAAGIDMRRVRSTGGTGEGIRADATSERTRFFRLPVFMKFTEDADNYLPNARPMILKRSCTVTYKLEPIKREYRRILGAKVSESGRVGSAPAGSRVTQQIGISKDEIQRASASREPWIVNSFPLLDLGWSRDDCASYLQSKGWGGVEKSSCVGCPYHSNAEWRRIRDTMPYDWADAVRFDAEIRSGPKRERTDGTRWPAEFFLHPTGIPLAAAPIDPEPRNTQTSIFDFLLESEREFSCSPHGCAGDAEDWRAALSSAGGIDIENDRDGEEE